MYFDSLSALAVHCGLPAESRPIDFLFASQGKLAGLHDGDEAYYGFVELRRLRGKPPLVELILRPTYWSETVPAFYFRTDRKHSFSCGFSSVDSTAILWLKPYSPFENRPQVCLQIRWEH